MYLYSLGVAANVKTMLKSALGLWNSWAKPAKWAAERRFKAGICNDLSTSVGQFEIGGSVESHDHPNRPLPLLHHQGCLFLLLLRHSVPGITSPPVTPVPPPTRPAVCPIY